MVALLLVLVALVVVFVLLGMAIWALISVGVVGIVIGSLARLVLPGEQRIGILATVLLGWIGSVVGGFLGDHVAHTGWFLTVLIEIAVAAGLIGVYGLLPERRRPREPTPSPYRGW